MLDLNHHPARTLYLVAALALSAVALHSLSVSLFHIAAG
jgi:hypothetical protein